MITLNKAFIAVVACVLFATTLTAGQIPLSGTIRLPNGNAFNGTIRFILSYSAARDTSSSNIVVAQRVQFPVQNGTLPANAKITPNDVLSPANTFYTTQYISAAGAMIGQNVFYITGTQFDIGTAVPTPLTTSNISFGTFTGLDKVSTKNSNNTRKCDAFPGSSAGAKIVACIADLPSTGGVADARGMEGAQTISVNIMNGIVKPVQLLLGAATFTISSPIVLSAGASLEVIGLGMGTTTLTGSAGSYLFDTAAGTTVVNYGAIRDLSANITVGGGGFVRIGSTATDFNESFARIGWNFRNLFITGPGATSAGSIGFSVTQLLDSTWDNVTIKSFETPLVEDRGGNSLYDRVRFQSFRFGPKWSNKAGTGSIASGASSSTCVSCEFLGPTTAGSAGTGYGYTVTMDAVGVKFVNALYEPQPASGKSQGLIHVTNHGGKFQDDHGFISWDLTAGTLDNTFVFDNDYNDPQFMGTMLTVSFGVAAPITFGTPLAGVGTKAEFRDISAFLADIVLGQPISKFILHSVDASTSSTYHAASEITDEDGLHRQSCHSAYSQLVPTTGVGIETFYQCSGDQAITSVINRANGVFKPWTIQPSGMTVSPNAGTSGLIVNTSGVQAGISLNGVTGDPAVNYATGSTGSIPMTSQAEVTINWAKTWRDGSYYPQCQVLQADNDDTLSVLKIEGFDTTAITVRVKNANGSASTGTLYCTGFHP